MPNSFIKDPDSVLDYQFQWASWLDEDTISTSTVTAETGLTVDSSSATSDTVTVWLSGGTVGERYTVVNHILTAAGREDDRTATIIVAEK